MSIPIYRPYVFLRCRKCGRKTDHVLINTTILFRFGKGEIEETYECQRCGETKKIYEFATSHVDSPMQRPVKQRLREPLKRAKVEQKKDYMEVTIKKKKHKFF